MFNFGDDPPLNVDPKKQGFIYDADITNPDTMAVTNEQRILKSNASGFKEPDKKHIKTDYGLVDWTDGTTLVVWHGNHRYTTPSGSDKVVYKNGTKIDYDILIAGSIAGAAYKNGVMLVFGSSAGVLKYYFFKGTALQTSGTVGSYNLTQIVSVSQNCTKACFIDLSTDGKTLTIVDMTVVINTVDDIYTVTVASSTAQDVEDHTDYAAGMTTDLHEDPVIGIMVGYYYDVIDRANLEIIIAVDYSDNTQVFYTVATSLSVDNTIYVSDSTDTGSLHDGDPIRESITNTDVNATATVTHNGETLTTSIVYNVNGYSYYAPDVDGVWILMDAANSPDYPDFFPRVDPIGDLTYRFRIIEGLDLRYGFVAYTECVETNKNDNGKFSLDRNYVLKMGAYSSTFDSPMVYDYDGIAAPLPPSLYQWFFTRLRSDGASFNPFFATFIKKAVFIDSKTEIVEFNGTAWVLNDREYNWLTNDIGELRTIALFDRFKNAVLKLSVFKSGVLYDAHGTPVFIKIDKDHTLTANTITNLKGII